MEQHTKIIKDYLKALEIGSYEQMMKLFTDDAIVLSPLYGKIEAMEFYKDLFNDTSNSKITLMNILHGEKENTSAGHFRYDWILKNGTPTSFECVDVFIFSNDNKIKQLTIIYDTARIRPSFENMKS